MLVLPSNPNIDSDQLVWPRINLRVQLYCTHVLYAYNVHYIAYPNVRTVCRISANRIDFLVRRSVQSARAALEFGARERRVAGSARDARADADAVLWPKPAGRRARRELRRAAGAGASVSGGGGGGGLVGGRAVRAVRAARRRAHGDAARRRLRAAHSGAQVPAPLRFGTAALCIPTPSHRI